ncbi:uncharacterized protein LOC133730724 [Rosa rugosa]|uniref:uncharacterized protein LOC133730724 n=1 Tax=Rosa rugosa TaxID=74645 RepID=UPI002B411355|nr:uncharacterized protein LOC133730724 [Rosa rugosa]
MRLKWGIPDAVELRPLKEGEMAANPVPGWVALHENQFHQGLSLPLPRCLQYLLRMLNLSPGQLTPNAIRQIYSMMAMWDLCQQGWPSVNEFRAVHRILYSRKLSCAGTVTFAARDYEPLVTDMPSSMSKRWRNKVFLAGGRWQIKNKKWHLTGTFQAIGDQAYTLSEVERKRIARVYAVWNEKERSSYRFIRHSILYRLGLGWLPVKAPKRKPRKGKEEDRMDDNQLMDMLMNQGEDALHIEVDLGSKATGRSIEETLLEITDAGYGEPDPNAPATQVEQPSAADIITIADPGREKVSPAVSISSRSTGSDEALLPGEKKRSHRHRHRGDKQEVTYTGRDVKGSGAKRQKRELPVPDASPSLGLLAPAIPVIPKKPIKQLLSEYGVADEKFVQSMLSDLKDIDLDRVRAKDNTPKENRRLARESIMRVWGCFILATGTFCIYILTGVFAGPVQCVRG